MRAPNTITLTPTGLLPGFGGNPSIQGSAGLFVLWALPGGGGQGGDNESPQANGRGRP